MFCIIKLNCPYVTARVFASREDAMRRIEQKSQMAPDEWYAIAEYHGEIGISVNDRDDVGDVLEIWHNGHGIEWIRESA